MNKYTFAFDPVALKAGRERYDSLLQAFRSSISIKGDAPRGPVAVLEGEDADAAEGLKRQKVKLDAQLIQGKLTEDRHAAAVRKLDREAEAMARKLAGKLRRK